MMFGYIPNHFHNRQYLVILVEDYEQVLHYSTLVEELVMVHLIVEDNEYLLLLL